MAVLSVGEFRTSRRRPARLRRRHLTLALRYLVVAIALLFVLFPIFWMVMAAFKLPGDYLHHPPVWIPNEFTLVHFIALVKLQGYVALKNSVIIATGATFLSMAVGS